MAAAHLQDRLQPGHLCHVAVTPAAGDDGEGVTLGGLELRRRHRLVAPPHDIGDLVQMLQVVRVEHLLDAAKRDVEDYLLLCAHETPGGSIGEPSARRPSLRGGCLDFA